MPSRCCTVSFIDTEKVQHSVEVSAASVYEACVLGMTEFRKCGFAEINFGPATVLTVSVKGRKPSTARQQSLASNALTAELLSLKRKDRFGT